MKLSLKPKCTCDSKDFERHYLSCDLHYADMPERTKAEKKKRFFFFYPLKKA